MKVQLWQASGGLDSYLPPPQPVFIWPPKPPSWRQNLLGKSLGKNTIDSALLELDEVGVVLSRRSCTRCCSWQATAGWKTNLREELVRAGNPARYEQSCELLHMKDESLSAKAFFSPKMGINESNSKSNPNFLINLAQIGQYSFV